MKYLLVRCAILSCCLFLSSPIFSQQRPPVLIPYEQDTLVGISQHQFDVVLFSFKYLRLVESDLNMVSDQLTRSDSINALLRDQLTLERIKTAHTDSIIDLQEVIISDGKKAARKSKVKNIALEIGLGAALVAETILLFLSVK